MRPLWSSSMCLNIVYLARGQGAGVGAGWGVGVRVRVGVWVGVEGKGGMLERHVM